jgi:hypothetical protein
MQKSLRTPDVTDQFYKYRLGTTNFSKKSIDILTVCHLKFSSINVRICNQISLMQSDHIKWNLYKYICLSD